MDAPLAIINTDASGSGSGTVNVLAEPSFNTDRDPNAQCPPTHEQVNMGLTNRQLALTQFGRGTIAPAITFAGQPTPAPPTLGVNPSTATVGSTVTLTGANWRGNPNSGSHATSDSPGETQLTVEVCNADGTGCVAAPADAAVAFALYTGAAPNFFNGTLSGSTLNGTFTVPAGGCTGSCQMRVTQQRFGGGAPLVATAPITIQHHGADHHVDHHHHVDHQHHGADDHHHGADDHHHGAGAGSVQAGLGQG
ncbi:MAG: hypothetical protein M3396_01125 [Actinomycetota bacterium]|nr:hypothetical protein [Actinomycetota bacterium]MDQ3574744.1 hypothetical protein [Actinomycetota bacterium]